MYRVKLSVEVKLEDSLAKEPIGPALVEIFLERSFRLDELSLVGTSLQAGSWEALKAAVNQLNSRIGQTTQVLQEIQTSTSGTKDEEERKFDPAG